MKMTRLFLKTSPGIQLCMGSFETLVTHVAELESKKEVSLHNLLLKEDLKITWGIFVTNNIDRGTWLGSFSTGIHLMFVTNKTCKSSKVIGVGQRKLAEFVEDRICRRNLEESKIYTKFLVNTLTFQLWATL